MWYHITLEAEIHHRFAIRLAGHDLENGIHCSRSATLSR